MKLLRRSTEDDEFTDAALNFRPLNDGMIAWLSKTTELFRLANLIPHVLIVAVWAHPLIPSIIEFRDAEQRMPMKAR